MMKDNNVPEEADYNTIDINFEELINNEKNDTIKTLHNYFSNVIGTVVPSLLFNNGLPSFAFTIVV